MIIFNIETDSLTTKTDLTDALKMVIDPELQVNIVDLGLVYLVALDELQKKITVEMTLSSKFCPMGDSILSATKRCMERNFVAYNINVELVWEPEWDYSFVTTEGLALLDAD